MLLSAQELLADDLEFYLRLTPLAGELPEVALADASGTTIARVAAGAAFSEISARFANRGMQLSLSFEGALHCRLAELRVTVHTPGDLGEFVRQLLWAGHDPYATTPVLSSPPDLQGWNSQHTYLSSCLPPTGDALVIEVGVWKGASTAFIAGEMAARGRRGAVIAVDTWLGSSEHWLHQRGAGWARDVGRDGLYRLFLTNMASLGLSRRCIPLPLDSLNAAAVVGHLGLQADMIHVDAGHDFNSVMADLQAWWPNVRPGGWLVGDDYSWPTVSHAFNTFFAGQPGTKLEVLGVKCRVQKPLQAPG